MNPTHKSLDHGSTVVVCNDLCEFNYVKTWCINRGFLDPYLGDPNTYPFCVRTKDGAWTTSMDRALYYMCFTQFLEKIKGAEAPNMHD